VKRGIYICRKVENSCEIKAWARTQGFASCWSDLHVTVAFDHKKKDWRDLPLEAEPDIAVVDPDDRVVSLFKNGAVVLEIYSRALTARWAELHQSALSWKYPDYRPHITITYQIPEGMDVGRIQPFDGVIKLGPEVISEVVWNQRTQVQEEDL
jgi:hypothetical protein